VYRIKGRTFDSRVLRKICWPKGQKSSGKLRKWPIEELCICSVPHTLFELSSHGLCDGMVMRHARGRQKYMHAGILVEKREEHVQFVLPRLRWDDNIQMDLKESVGRAWAEAF